MRCVCSCGFPTAPPAAAPCTTFVHDCRSREQGRGRAAPGDPFVNSEACSTGNGEPAAAAHGRGGERT
jgi:hypothetical protein